MIIINFCVRLWRRSREAARRPPAKFRYFTTSVSRIRIVKFIYQLIIVEAAFANERQKLKHIQIFCSSRSKCRPIRGSLIIRSECWRNYEKQIGASLLRRVIIYRVKMFRKRELSGGNLAGSSEQFRRIQTWMITVGLTFFLLAVLPDGELFVNIFILFFTNENM